MPADDEALIPIEKPTGHHRYVLRHQSLRQVPGTNILSADQAKATRTHQQQWSVITFDQGSNGTERLEWRDVPLVEEDTVADTYQSIDQINERRRQGLPDYPKPPLGQPPAFLQEQEPKEAYAGEERLAREAAGVSANALALRLEASIKANEAMLGRLLKMQAALRWIVENGPGSHPANVIKVAEEGLQA